MKKPARNPYPLTQWLRTAIVCGLAFCGTNCSLESNAADGVTESDSAKVTLVADGFKFTEGPTVDSKGNVYFTDQPNDRIMKIDLEGKVSEYLKPAGRANGMYFTADDKLIACADERNEMWEIASDKTHKVLFSQFDGANLNGPNDVWIDDDGTIYFTDPYYQRPWWTHKKPPQPRQAVYRADRDGAALICVDDAVTQPNGIIGDAKKRILYVADIGASKTYKYKIEKDGSLVDRKLFCNAGSDGMTIDEAGNVYLTGGKGVSVYSEEGKLVQLIEVPESWSANVCLGGKDRKTLYVTSSDSVYSIRVKFAGVGRK